MLSKQTLGIIGAYTISILLLNSCDTSASSSYASGKSDPALVKEYFDFDSPARAPHNKSHVRIKISKQNKALYVVEDNDILLSTPVSLGSPKTPTPTGHFSIKKMVHKKRANTHGWAYNTTTGDYCSCKIGDIPRGWKFVPTAMPYWCEFLSPSYGIHIGFIYDYGRSHGCVRTHHNVMPKIFQMVKIGTPVDIAQTQPEDYTVGKNLKRPPNPELIPDDPELETSDKVFYFHKPVSFEN